MGNFQVGGATSRSSADRITPTAASTTASDSSQPSFHATRQLHPSTCLSDCARGCTATPHADIQLNDELEALASEYMQSARSCFMSLPSSRQTALASGSISGVALRSDREYVGQDVAALIASSSADSAASAPITWQRGQMLGAGSFGRVYFGLNSSTGELMAVKQIKYTPGQPTDGTRQAALALQREVRCLQALTHPNIVRYLGVERDDVNGVISICLEYCAGGSIASLLEKFGAFNEALTRSYMRMILAGLSFLHTRPSGGILHRDIKGANVLVDSDGICKLADFGASKQIQQDLVSSTDGCRSLRGTPYWMAPEVIKQTGHGRPADVWSLGCTMVEMLTARPPWSHFTSQISALFHIASSKSPPPLPQNISPGAASFLLRTLVREPRDRADVVELADHPFLAPCDHASRAPFSQVVINREGALVVTQVGDRTADVFGSLPRGVELLSSSSPVPVAVPVRKVGCVQGLAIKGQSAPLPCSNSTGSGLCGDGTNGSSSARLAVPTAARTRKGNTQVERFDENIGNPYVAAAVAAAARRPVLEQRVTQPSLQPIHPPCREGPSHVPTQLHMREEEPTQFSAEDLLVSQGMGAVNSCVSKNCVGGSRWSSSHTDVDGKAAMSAFAVEEAIHEARLVREQRERLLEEKAKKKVLWEEELQRELEYQRHIKASREAHRKSTGSSQVYPDG